jgi:replicative DNA helicase
LAQVTETRGRPRVGTEPVRRIPADHEAERAVLGAILLDHDALYRVLDKVKAHHFDDPRHRVVYEALIALAEKHQAISLIGLRSHLEESDLLDRAGGLAFVASLAGAVPTTAHVEEHARIVRDKALARSLVRTCEEVAARGYEGATPVRELLDDAERAVLDVAEGHVEVPFAELREELEPTFDYIVRFNAGEITGVQTGFEDFDRLTGGFNGGDLVVLAARPSVGKTALALNIARNCAIDFRGCVGIFSLEMSKRQLILRVLMAEAEVSFSRFQNAYLGERDMPRLTGAADRLQNARVFIDDSGVLTVGDITAKARRLNREHQLSLIIVDYIQLIHSARPGDRREQEVAETTRLLKLLAKDLDVPVMALSQLNRGPETRPNPHKRPMLADLRESGAIEQDADTVLFIYRDELYNPDTPDAGIAELIVAKQRNGPTGTVKLRFDGKFARFQNYTERDAPPASAGFDPEPGWGEDPEEPPF